jgi:uncharacterized protein YecE (DUF72 family)
MAIALKDELKSRSRTVLEISPKYFSTWDYSNFRFTAKFPKVITHDRRVPNFDEDQLSYFFDSISELKEKLLALLIQLPPSIDTPSQKMSSLIPV